MIGQFALSTSEAERNRAIAWCQQGSRIPTLGGNLGYWLFARQEAYLFFAGPGVVD